MGDQTAAAQAQPAPRRATVLVVDDEVYLRLIVGEELRSHGFEVLEAASADEAAKILDSGLPIDLLFTDLRMPGTMDGSALVMMVRAQYPAVKRIVASSHQPDPAVRAAADRFISKPYDLCAVVAEAAQLLGWDSLE